MLGGEATMYVRASGKPSKVPIKLCKEAVKFYGRQLLGETLYHKLEITINFETFKSNSNEYAFCEWEFENHRSRDFIITIDKKLSESAMLLALAHEMVHVKQYAKGELKDYLKVHKSKWKGEIIDPNVVDYWDQPWEIEAHGREKGLYIRFVEQMKK
jgi:hypothetical protein